MHFNTRFLSTSESWFGGGMDITPANSFEEESKFFHTGLKKMCDKHDIVYYEKYKNRKRMSKSYPGKCLPKFII